MPQCCVYLFAVAAEKLLQVMDEAASTKSDVQAVVNRFLVPAQGSTCTVAGDGRCGRNTTCLKTHRTLAVAGLVPASLHRR